MVGGIQANLTDFVGYGWADFTQLDVGSELRDGLPETLAAIALHPGSYLHEGETAVRKFSNDSTTVWATTLGHAHLLSPPI